MMRIILYTGKGGVGKLAFQQQQQFKAQNKD